MKSGDCVLRESKPMLFSLWHKYSVPSKVSIGCLETLAIWSFISTINRISKQIIFHLSIDEPKVHIKYKSRQNLNDICTVFSINRICVWQCHRFRHNLRIHNHACMAPWHKSVIFARVLTNSAFIYFIYDFHCTYRQTIIQLSSASTCTSLYPVVHFHIVD